MSLDRAHEFDFVDDMRATGAPRGEVTVRARASRAASAVEVDVGGGHQAFVWCVEEKVAHEFAMGFRRHTQLEDGSIVSESMIDGDAAAEVSFVVETQEQYGARLEKEREERQRRWREVSRERVRQRRLFWGR